MKKISIVVIIMIALLACSDGADKNAEVKPAASNLAGKVIETMDSGGYTYAQIDAKGKKVWFAVPKTKIDKGSTVAFIPGAPMANFKSKTLGKTLF
jgi:hypothetical protein